MALHSLHCADVPLRNCSLTHYPCCSYTTQNLNLCACIQSRCHRKVCAINCDSPGCRYTTHEANTMSLHKATYHKQTQAPNATATDETKCTNASSTEYVVSRDTIDDDVEPDSVGNSHATYVRYEANTDVCSIRSSKSTASRRVRHIAPVVSYVQNVRHTANTVKSDNASSVALDTGNVRRSTRICNRKRKSTAVNSESEATQCRRSKVYESMETWWSVDRNVEPTETVIGDLNVV